MEHIRQIPQDIPRKIFVRVCLLDQLRLKFMMGLGPRARTTNINSFIQLLGYNMEYEQQQRGSKSKSFAFSKTVAPESLVNKAGVLERICSIAQLAIYVLVD